MNGARRGGVPGSRLAVAVGLTLLLGCSAPRHPGATSPAALRPPPAPATSGRLIAPVVRRLSTPGWVEVVAEVVASEDEAPARARQRALRRARQAAVEFVAGVRVQSSLLSLEQAGGREEISLLQVLTATRSDALVIDEDLRDSRISVLPAGGYRVRVTLRARVLDRGGDTAGSFSTEARLNGHLFRDGEAVQLSVRASEDARIYVVALSDAGAVVLLPNRHLRDTRVQAGRWLHFPTPELRARGVRLEARLSDGAGESREGLLIVALRGNRRLEDLFPAAGDTFRSAESSAAPLLLNDLLAPLLEIPARDWTFDQLVYSVAGR